MNNSITQLFGIKYPLIQAGMIWVLNCFWYTFILKGLIRLLEDKGFLTKGKEDKYNDVDEMEAAQIGVYDDKKKEK